MLFDRGGINFSLSREIILLGAMDLLQDSKRKEQN